jgi:LPS-assembly lipoprotein
MKIRILASLLLCVLVTGCGFHMRGSANGVSNVKSLNVVTGSPYNRFSRILDQQMQYNHIEQNASSGWNLQIIRERLYGNTIAFSDNTYAASRELILEVRFSVSNPAGEQVIAPNTERVVRILESDNDRRLSEDREDELLRDEMYEQAAANILRRIDYLAGQKPQD